MRKLIIVSASLTFLVIAPAIAQVGNVWNDFKSYASDLQEYRIFNRLIRKLKLQSIVLTEN